VHGSLTPKQLLALEHDRHRTHLEDELAEERCDRKRLQTQVDDLGPRCKALEAIHVFDMGITTCAAIANLIGNVVVAWASFRDQQKGKEYWLIGGLVITLISSLFVLGIHRFWMPRAKEKADEPPKKVA
jgi:hypothetical protein